MALLFAKFSSGELRHSPLCLGIGVGAFPRRESQAHHWFGAPSIALGNSARSKQVACRRLQLNTSNCIYSVMVLVLAVLCQVLSCAVE